MNEVKAIVPDKLDPLFIVFEQHLYNFQDSNIDRKTFIAKVVHDYLTHLRKMGITVPRLLEKYVIDELAIQVNTMLVKKIYGFLTLEDFKKNISSDEKRRAQNRYRRLRTSSNRVKAK